MYFAPGSPKNTPSNLPEEPSETAPADIIKDRKLDFDINDEGTILADLSPCQQFP